MKKEQRPHMCNVRNDVKNFYDQEKYRHYTKGRGRVFDKQYILLNKPIRKEIG